MNAVNRVSVERRVSGIEFGSNTLTGAGAWRPPYGPTGQENLAQGSYLRTPDLELYPALKLVPGPSPKRGLKGGKNVPEPTQQKDPQNPTQKEKENGSQEAALHKLAKPRYEEAR